MNPRELEALTALCVMAAMADGSKHESERARIQAIFDGLARSEDSRALASAYGRVMLKQTSLADEARALESNEARILAYEMAVAVCDADGACTPAEKQFLADLQRALQILPAQASALNATADAVAEAGLPPPLPTGAAAGAPRVAGVGGTGSWAGAGAGSAAAADGNAAGGTAAPAQVLLRRRTRPAMPRPTARS
jgi:tellurite resistance protein